MKPNTDREQLREDIIDMLSRLAIGVYNGSKKGLAISEYTSDIEDLTLVLLSLFDEEMEKEKQNIKQQLLDRIRIKLERKGMALIGRLDIDKVFSDEMLEAAEKMEKDEQN